jgi:hypothetical protein
MRSLSDSMARTSAGPVPPIFSVRSEVHRPAGQPSAGGGQPRVRHHRHRPRPDLLREGDGPSSPVNPEYPRDPPISVRSPRRPGPTAREGRNRPPCVRVLVNPFPRKPLRRRVTDSPRSLNTITVDSVFTAPKRTAPDMALCRSIKRYSSIKTPTYISCHECRNYLLDMGLLPYITCAERS